MQQAKIWEVNMKKNNNSPLKMVFHRFLKDKAAVVAGIVFLSIVFIGIFANFLTPYDPNAADVTIRLQSPSMDISWEQTTWVEIYSQD